MDIPSPSGTGGKAYAKNMGHKNKGPKVRDQTGKLKETVQICSNSNGKDKNWSNGPPRSNPQMKLGCKQLSQKDQRHRPVGQPATTVDQSFRNQTQEQSSKEPKEMKIDPTPNKEAPTLATSCGIVVARTNDEPHDSVAKNTEVSILPS